jgi:hypothetical protein
MTTGHGLIVSAALALALTACTDDEPKADPSPSATASVESTATESTATESVDPSNVSPDGLPTIPEVKGAKGDIGALTLGECHTEAGRQTVTGEVTSSAAKSTDYLVTLSWTTGDSDVMGRGFAVVRDLEPGATEGFTIKAAVAKGAAQCVPGVVYGNVAGT